MKMRGVLLSSALLAGLAGCLPESTKKENSPVSPEYVVSSIGRLYDINNDGLVDVVANYHPLEPGRYWEAVVVAPNMVEPIIAGRFGNNYGVTKNTPLMTQELLSEVTNDFHSQRRILTLLAKIIK